MNKESPLLKSSFIIFFIAVLIWGAALRINDQWKKDLWVDEVWRAQQILHAESYAELKTGKYFGMEPAVHLSEYVLGKIGLSLFGKSEIAYRIWPLLFSISSLFVFAVLSLFLLSKNWAIFATILYAGSAGLIEHSNEFKPYSYESLIFNLFLLAIIIKARYKSIYWLSILILILAFLSVIYTAIWPFIWALVLAQLCYEIWPRIAEIKTYFYSHSRYHQIISIIFIIVAITFAGIFATEYLYNLKSRKIFIFWQPYTLTSVEQIKAAFLDRLGEFHSWYVTSIFTVNEVLYSGPVLTLIYFFIAPFILYSKKSLILAPLLAIFIAQIIFSLFGLFPVFTRVASFQTGLYILVISALGEYFSSLLAGSNRRIELVVLLFTVPLIIFFHGIEDYSGRHMHIQRIKPLINRIEKYKAQNPNQNIILVANYSAQLGLKFYGINYKIERDTDTNLKDTNVSPKDVEQFINGISEHLSDNNVIFILVTHRIEAANTYKNELRKLGYKAKLYQKQGAYMIRLKA